MCVSVKDQHSLSSRSREAVNLTTYVFSKPSFVSTQASW